VSPVRLKRGGEGGGGRPGEPCEERTWCEGGEECDTDVVASLDVVEGDPGKGRGGMGIDMVGGGGEKARTDPSEGEKGGKGRKVVSWGEEGGKELDLEEEVRRIRSTYPDQKQNSNHPSFSGLETRSYRRDNRREKVAEKHSEAKHKTETTKKEERQKQRTKLH